MMDAQSREIAELTKEIGELTQTVKSANKVLTEIVASQGMRIRSLGTKGELLEKVNSEEHVRQAAFAEATAQRVDDLEVKEVGA